MTLRERIDKILRRFDTSEMSWYRANNLIITAIKESMPEEKAIPAKEDDSEIHEWSIGFNACRTEMLRRLEN